MTQHALTIGDQTGSSFLTDITNALKALGNLQKGNARPSGVQAGWFWLDDNTPSTTVWTLNFYDGADDIPVAFFDTTNNTFLPILGGTTRLFQSSTDTPGYGNTFTGGSIEKNAQGAALFLSRSNFAALYLNSNTASDVATFLLGGAVKGTISVASGGTAYNTTSDPLLKDRVEQLAGGLDRIRKVRVYRHGWKAEPGGPLVDGVMAPEFGRLFPWAVTKRRRGAKGVIIQPMQVDYSKAVPATIAAVQDLDAIVKWQAARITAQEREMRTVNRALRRQQRAIDKLATLVGRLLK